MNVASLCDSLVNCQASRSLLLLFCIGIYKKNWCMCWSCLQDVSPSGWCAGLIHLFFITTSLWTFGKYLERVLAVPILSVGFVYVVSGFAGAITSANLVIPYNAVGASAGICGLLGEFLLLSEELRFVLIWWVS